LAIANDATIAGAIKAAQKYGKIVTADTIGVRDRLQRATELKLEARLEGNDCKQTRFLFNVSRSDL
jgi:3-keto-L-gulonate-6-phosphate decarboxylase